MEMQYHERGMKEVEYHERDTCSSPRAKIFLVMTVSFVIAAVVVLVVILTRIESTPYVEPDTVMFDCDAPCNQSDNVPKCPDLAIIGGGLAGTYAAWKLRHMNITITIYEQTSRLGGRIHTTSFPANASDDYTDSHSSNNDDVTEKKNLIELGASYFIPKIHHLMANLTRDLGLNVSYMEEEVMYYLRGRHIAYADLANSSRVPYNLFDKEERGVKPIEIIRETLQATVPVNTGEGAQNTYDQHMDVRSALLRDISKEAYNFIADTSWPGDFLPQGSASQLLDYVNALETQDVAGIKDYATLQEAGGMQRVVDGMAEQLYGGKARVSIRYNHQLYKIENNKDIYRIYFHGTEDHSSDQAVYCAHQVVLALPPESIQQVEWPPFQQNDQFKQNLKSVFPVEASKLFLQYNSSWWPFNATHVQTDTPLGQVEYLGSDDSTNHTVLQAMYTAEEYFGYWDRMMEEGFSIQGDLARLTNHTIGNIPVQTIFHQWDGSSHGSAWHVWKPDVDWLKTAEEMLEPINGDRVYVVGSAFAPGYMNKWMEGALYTVEQILDRVQKAIANIKSK